MARSRLRMAWNEIAGAMLEARKFICVLHARDERRFVWPREFHFARGNAHICGGKAIRAFKDEAGGMLDAHRFGFPGHGILDRLCSHLDGIADLDATVLAIHLKINRHKTRAMNRGEGGDDDFEWQPAVLAAGDLRQRVALGCVRFFIDVKASDAVALVDCFRPAYGHRKAEAIEGRILITSLDDFPGDHSFAIAARGWRAEFTRTAVVAIASLDEIRLEVPFCFPAHNTSQEFALDERGLFSMNGSALTRIQRLANIDYRQINRRA
jgi:hypothetical protein